MPVQKVAGKAGSFKYAGVILSMKKWTAKVTRDLADTTDSDDYDAGTDMLYKSQVPVALQVEANIEGFFDLNSTDATIVTSLYSAATKVAVVLGINASVTFGHGPFDLSDFEVDAPIDDVVTWKATAKSNGLFVRGS